MDTSRRSAFRNSDQDPVVKSWNRVPTPITRSAAMQSSLAQSEPVTPGEPKLRGCVAASAPLPAWVSTNGMLWRSANAASTSSASEYSTPPPEMITGREAFASMAATSATSRGSGSGRRMRQVRGSKKSAG